MALPSSTYDTATLVNPTTNLTDFTLVVDLSRMSAAWWAAVDTSDGTKGRAAKDSGPSELACDWIDFDSVNETGLLRVKWSGTLSSSGTQTLRIYPPQSTNASVAASDTYGSDNAYGSDWAAYWPLAVDTNDRTVNGYNLTAQGGVTLGAVAGKLGAATQFDGIDDGLEDTSQTPVDGYPTTYIFWVLEEFSPSGGAPFILSVNEDTFAYQYMTLLGTIVCQESDGISIKDTIGDPIITDTWYMHSTQYVSNSSTFVWKDDIKSSENTANMDSTGRNKIYITGWPFGGLWGKGKMQHVQVHSASLPDAWIEYEYDQTSNQATFWGTWINVALSTTTKAYWWG